MSTSPTAEKPKPSPRYTVDLGDGNGERSIFMSFGLLNELTAMIGGPENIPQVSFDPNLSQAALESVLVRRDKHGRPIPLKDEDPPIIPAEMDPEVAEQLLDWVAAHALDFFIRRFQKSANLLGTGAGQLAEIGSSLNSSPTSGGKTA